MLKRYVSSSIRLVEKHSEFLSLVKDHGEGHIRLSQIDHVKNVVEIEIDQKVKRNSISGRMMYDLAITVDEIEALSLNQITCLILRGSGSKSFCAGADINLVKNIVNDEFRGGLMSSFMSDALNRIRQSCFISVCCINGPAIGGGAELITACDFRIIPNVSTTYVHYVHAQIGACPGWGGIGRLLNILSRQQVIQLVGSSIKVNPCQALEIGLVDALIDSFNPVDEVISDSDYDHAYDEYCRDASLSFLKPYLSQPYPSSLRAIKQSIAAYECMSLQEAQAIEKTMFMQRWGNTDNKDAIRLKFPDSSSR